jgi:hypothetical protein
MLQHRMRRVGGLNRDGMTNTVLTEVVDVLFKEHSRKKNPQVHKTVGLGQ